MKKTTWKKIMSLVLVAALVIGCLQLNAKKVSATTTTEVAEPTAKMNDKTNAADPNSPAATYTVTGGEGLDISFTGEDTDIVLVIDLSNSMVDEDSKDANGNTRLDNAKAAAISFVEELLGEGKESKKYVRIAVLTYGTAAINVTEGFKSDLTAIKAAINGLTVNSNNGGTNIDDVLEMTEELFKNDTNKKVMVLLSDGAPTFANGTNNSGIWVRTETFSTSGMSFVRRAYFNSDGRGYSDGRYFDNAVTKEEYYKKNGVEYMVVSRRQNKNDSWHIDSYWTKRYDIIGDGHTVPQQDVINATTTEATKAKNSGINIYTILFADTDTNAESVMKAIASADKDGNKQFYSSENNADAAAAVYAKIVKEIKDTIYSGTDAYIKAILSDYVDIDAAKLVGHEDELTYLPNDATANGQRTITWTIGTLDNDIPESPVIGFKVKDFVTAEYLKKNVTPVDGFYTLPVTAQTKLYYKKDGQWQTPIDVTNLIFVKYPVDSVIDYKINYYVDYEEVVDELITTEEGTVFAGSTVEATKKTVAQIVDGVNGYNANYYTLKPNQGFSLEVTANTKELNIYVTHNKATVKFYQMSETEAGEYEDEAVYTDTVYYGDKVSFVDRYAADRTFVNNEVVSEAAITYKWLETWNDGYGKNKDLVVEQKVVTLLADYDQPTKGDLYTISYVNDDDSPLPGGVTQRPGTTTNAPESASKGEDPQFTYEFKEWQLVGGTEVVVGGGEITVDGNKTYKAVYTPVTKTFTATFVANGQDIDVQEEIPYGQFATEPSEELTAGLTDDYKKFVGWDKEVDKTAIVENTTFTAQFEDQEYTVAYVAYYGTASEAKDSFTVKAGTDIETLNRYDKKGFVFAGYKVNDGNDFVLASNLAFKDIHANLTINVYYNVMKANLVFYTKAYGSEENTVLTRTEYTSQTTKAEFASYEADATSLGNLFVEWRAYPVVDDTPNTTGPRALADGYFTFAEVAAAYEPGYDVMDIEFYPFFKEAEPIITPTGDPVITQPLILPVITETPEEPTPEPTATPTPTAEPIPTAEPEIEIEETETPEGDVVEDLEPVDTPQSAPEEEELDVEPIDTPQGDLPKTGVAPSAVFFGIGAACVVFGGAIVLKLRRKEEM